MKVTLIDAENHILAEIADKTMTRDDVAASYALAVGAPESVNWAAVNQAIMDRWSLSALRYIKDKAWKLREA